MSVNGSDSAPQSGAPLEGESNISTRSASDTTSQFARHSSQPLRSEGDLTLQREDSNNSDNPYEPTTYASEPTPRQHEVTRKIFGNWVGGAFGDNSDNTAVRTRSNRGRRRSSSRHLLEDKSTNAQNECGGDDKRRASRSGLPKVGAMPRPVGGSEKLGTFSGVFVPTSLNVLSILMFLRFGFILGQTGVVGMMGMLIASYLINLVTTMSISAIASNGTVRGGGAYYLISRSLGPEFGGSIGIVFYLGFVFNTGMNAVGLIDCLNQNFGSSSGNWSHILREGFWWQYLWGTIVLLLCTAICLAGSSIFARCSNALLAILLIATFSIPFSALIRQPFVDQRTGTYYTGLSLRTLRENLMPHFTKHAAGSQLRGKENFQDLFGILFPATGGIMAGASMSGDLQNPSKSIPRGTLYGLAMTFVSYSLVILAMAATIRRQSFRNNVNVLQDTNISEIVVLLGEMSTTLFSTLMGVIGPAKLLQAIARDSLLPGLGFFSQGTAKSDEPTYAIIFTYVVAQITMIFDINKIAMFITMAYLMTFFVMNLACFLLKISSAPNFRPSFHYFNWWTAAAGALLSAVSMFFVDGLYATGCVGVLVIIFLIIHYTTPPKSWGDVSQSLIYHQVRKYLLRLKQEHVKFWRPQILLFVNDPRRGYKLIQFCNSLKKGGLFVLGHVIVTHDFGSAVPEARRQQSAWAKYVEYAKVKAFTNIAISPAVEWGTRNIVLSTGLGGMRPNIVIMGAYNLDQFRKDQPLVDVPSAPVSRKTARALGANDEEIERKRRKRANVTKQLEGVLPTDLCKTEGEVGIQGYVMVLEDMILKLQINVAVAKGFQDLELPDPKGHNTKAYIDLWPIQMSAEIAAEGGQHHRNVLTTNFDTYTLILQLGCILHTVPRWNKSYKLRVAVFVEYESDVEEERGRVATLLDNLRIQAEILVFWLASGAVKSYKIIVNSEASEMDAEVEHQVEETLHDETWWQEVKKFRGKIATGNVSAVEELADVEGLLHAAPSWPSSSFQYGKQREHPARFEGLRRLVKQSRRRRSMSSLSHLGVSLGMRTHHLDENIVRQHASHASASEDSESSDEAASNFSTSDSEDEGTDGRPNTAVSDSGPDERFSDMSDVSETHSAGSSKRSSKRSKQSPKGSYSTARASKKQSLRHAAHKSASEANLGDLRKENAGAWVAGAAESTSPKSSVETPKQSDTPLITTADVRGDASPTQSREEPPKRPPTIRNKSTAKFSSRPVPRTKVASDDGPGPSIMFTDTDPVSHPGLTADDSKVPQNGKHRSIYDRKPSAPATGFPAAASVPLSFNDLPCRAQHLILNELITQQSADTAVVFTTLPAPMEGTHQSEADSIGYVSDLEVLCSGLPPVLLIHSNSMTVTMNL